jgi:hypothetical protein
MRWGAGHETGIGKIEMRRGVWWGNLKKRERGELEELDVDERIISKWILRKWNERARIELIWFRDECLSDVNMAENFKVL